MKKAGRVKTWHADKGYGFIDMHAQTKDVFFHISAMQSRAVQPRPGDRVMFDLVKGKDGRMQAAGVTIAGAPKSQGQPGLLPVVLAGVGLAAVFAGALAGFLPRAAGLVCLVASLLAFLDYALDKRRARDNAWRIAEARLHVLALCGGWPGALAAQHLLRHKNRKRAFQQTFRATVVLNVVALVLWRHLMPA